MMALWQERTELLTGEEGIARLRDSAVAVIGLGGVGAYAAEMVARSGVGRMLIVDSDVVSDTNRNRQLLALTSTVGRSKAALMKERLLDINPALELTVVEEYLTQENIPAVVGNYFASGNIAAGNKKEQDSTDDGELPVPARHGIFLIDAIDTLAPKIALIKYAVEHRIPLVSSMGSGAKFDATKVRIADISKSFNCPLAYILRKKLRHEGISKGFKVVFSEELPEREAIVPTEGERNKKSQVGTISYLPAVFGCVCAQVAVTSLLGVALNK